MASGKAVQQRERIREKLPGVSFDHLGLMRRRHGRRKEAKAKKPRVKDDISALGATRKGIR